jgi:hypothetical protein
VIPQQQGVQAWDRYAYSSGNPLNYTDPGGQGMCDEKWADPVDCAEADPDGDGVVLTDLSQTSDDLVDDAIEDGYDQEDINRGLDILNALRGNPEGWWNQYIDWNNPESVWRFILALAFTYESYSYQPNQQYDQFLNIMTSAYTNQFWDLMDKYGNAGGLIYIGTMQTLNIRVGSLFSDLENLGLKQDFEDIFNTNASMIMTQSVRERDADAFYDFGSCEGACPYEKGDGNGQAIWLSITTPNNRDQAYVRSQCQFYSNC